MSHTIRRFASLGASVILALGGLAVATAAQAASVSPQLVAGNPTCTDLGFAHGTKFDYPTYGGGTYPVGTGQVTWSTTGTSVSFTSTVGIDAVIVKGGNAANAYVYDPPAESFGDSGLVTPDNASGGPAGLSHVEFCWDYNLTIAADAHVTYTRSHQWTIDKTADHSSLVLSAGQVMTVNYGVTVAQTAADHDFALTGTITVANPDPDNAANLTGVNSALQGVGGLSLDCGVSFPYALAAGGTLECTFTAPLPDGAPRLHSYEVTTTGLVGGAQGSATITAGGPTSEQDECVQVTDSVKGTLGTVCAADAPKTFSYAVQVGPYTQAQCGSKTLTNTAMFTANDTAATGSDTWTVGVTVPCVNGCTLTQGYWKTHSAKGPAPYDDTWAKLPAGANTVFFLSGKTYYQVLWTAPKGNAYYILADQYIAAKLNGLNGANMSSISTVFTNATNYFKAKTPTSTLTTAQRSQLISWAGTLEKYNAGLIGPGHCSE